ncbi:MAG: hypothetical protein AB7I79_01285 [Rhizobiaceae bacterium]
MADVDPNNIVSSGRAPGSTVGLLAPVVIDKNLTIGGNVPFTLTSGGIALDVTGSRILTVGDAVTIETTGVSAHGIRSLAGNSTIHFAGSLSTVGVAAIGINAGGGGNHISVSGDVTTDGDSAVGVRALGAGNIVVVTGLIRTRGPNSAAVGIGTDSSVSMSGRVEGLGDTNTAIIIGSGSTVEMSGSLLMSGSNAQGIIAGAGGSDILVSGDIIITGGTFSLGILTASDANTVEITGNYRLDVPHLTLVG